MYWPNNAKETILFLFNEHDGPGTGVHDSGPGTGVHGGGPGAGVHGGGPGTGVHGGGDSRVAN